TATRGCRTAAARGEWKTTGWPGRWLTGWESTTATCRRGNSAGCRHVRSIWSARVRPGYKKCNELSPWPTPGAHSTGPVGEGGPSDGSEEVDPSQLIQVKRGRGDYELEGTRLARPDTPPRAVNCVCRGTPPRARTTRDCGSNKGGPHSRFGPVLR